MVDSAPDDAIYDGARGDRSWAGLLRFPRSPADLRSTSTCPACFAALTSTTCRACGLDLTHPASADLAALSARIADDLDARADIVGRIRRATAEQRAAARAPEPQVPTTPTSAAVPAPAASTAPSARRRSSIQIALVVVGITLLSVFAVFGLVYAFVTYGETVRMLIIGAGTLATLLAAAALSRRGLTATAEGVAALGTIVLVLDAWALLLNDPEGLGALPARGYWGVALLIVGAVAATWSRWGHLASPAVAAAALLPLGAGLATAELSAQLALPPVGLLADSAAPFLGALAALGSAGLVGSTVSRRRPATRRAAHIVARSVGTVAAVGALASLVDLQPSERFAPLLGGLALGALVAAQLAPLAREAGDRRSALDSLSAIALGGGSALAAIVGLLLTTLRIEQDRASVSMPLIAAAAIALVGEQLWRRSRRAGVWRTGFASGTIVAATAAVIAAALSGVVGASAFAEAATASIRVLPGSVDGAVATPEPAVVAALGALALSAGLTAASWGSLGRLRSRASALGPVLAVIVVLTVPLAGAWWLVMLLFGVLALGGAMALRSSPARERDGARVAVVAALAPLIVGSALGAFSIGWAVDRGWMIGLTISLAAILLARTTTPHDWLRGLALGIAAALVLAVSGTVDRELSRGGIDWGAPAVLVLLAAVILVSVVLGRLTTVERLAAGGVALASAALALVAAPAEGIPFAAALAALVGALTVVATRGRGPERWAARIAIPAVVVRGAIALGTERLTEEQLAPLALAALALVAAVALAVRLRGAEDARLGLATDLAIAATGIAVLVLALADDAGRAPAEAALSLFVAAVIAVLAAASADGLVGSQSPRRHVGWLALVLASAALWILLLDSDVTQLEAFVLPVSGALLLIAALIARAGRGRAAGVSIVVGAALALALLPLAAASGVDAPWRLLAVGVIGACLALLAVTSAHPLDARFRELSRGFLVVGLGSLGLLVAAHVVRLGELMSASGPLAVAEQVRVVLLVAALAALALLAWYADASLPRQVVTVSSAGLAATMAGIAGMLDAVDPVELVSVPLALGLLGIGTLQLARHEEARSWPWLGPGILALLVPSLLAIDGAGEPLWRSVVLGVVAALVFVLALVRRLQAPFVLGGAVLVVHLLVQSWPLLEQVGRAVEWWIWLGLAGILVVAIAARYERRVQNVRDLTHRIADLR